MAFISTETYGSFTTNSMAINCTATADASWYSWSRDTTSNVVWSTWSDTTATTIGQTSGSISWTVEVPPRARSIPRMRAERSARDLARDLLREILSEEEWRDWMRYETARVRGSGGGLLPFGQPFGLLGRCLQPIASDRIPKPPDRIVRPLESRLKSSFVVRRGQLLGSFPCGLTCRLLLRPGSGGVELCQLLGLFAPSIGLLDEFLPIRFVQGRGGLFLKLCLLLA